MDRNWGEQLERRIAQLEAQLGTCEDPANAEIDEMIRRAFRTWLAFGSLMKWLVYVLAGIAGAIAAWKTILAEARAWLTG